MTLPEQDPRRESGPVSAPVVKGDHLEALLRSRLRFAGREWAIIIAVLVSPAPLTVRQVAERTRLAYPHAKAIVRGLVGWKILQRGHAGVAFQPNATLWGEPGR